MESSDSELLLSDEESQCGRGTREPEVDIEAINNTLTEVHQQYSQLLLKYSRALNIIDQLKCQLACSVNCSDDSSQLRIKYDALMLQLEEFRVDGNEIMRYTTDELKGRADVTPVVNGPMNPKLRSSSPQDDQRAMLENHHISTGFDTSSYEAPKTPTNVVSTTSESSSSVGLELFSRLFAASDAWHSHNAPVLVDEVDSAVAIVQDDVRNVVPRTPEEYEGAAGHSSRSRDQHVAERVATSHRKKAALVQPNYHQIAVVYPAQRNAELCSMVCSALDVAVKLAGELRKHSRNLLQQFQ
ncbi:hypothetical protein IscW_ISCW015678 [Ixodes scapularis]|uniref:Uncharacterized protein n=1 Tax=Ixodes scapularis TaxID=6945 RepID=B7P6L8_IXOSC|nr:hypothetical protein IscW_ISCW015678 [Ixodes scapularis]|eukprot:XP_002409013.1 hypothetical protein IscW_ISCW015678 [Ixodes scapularis]